MAISKLLIVIGLLTCIMLSVMAHTESPQQLKEGDLSVLIGYGYFEPPLPKNPEYVPYNEYFNEVMP